MSTVPVETKRWGMVCEATFLEAQHAYGDGEGESSRFDAVVPVHGGHEEERRWDTTARADFGGSGKPTRLEMLAARSAKAPPAGGSGAPRQERGIAASEVVGEAWRAGGDAKSQTAAQRSWLPSGDAGLAHLVNPHKPVAVGSRHSSLQIVGSASGGVVRDPRRAPGCATAAWKAPGRKQMVTRSSADASRMRGRRVFTDE
jgi:hypothetical protein